MKHRITYPFVIVSFLLILFTGCTKEELHIGNTKVEVVFSPEGVGDQGYNDKILRGLQKASARYGFTLAIHIPQEKEQGVQIYNEWLNRTLDEDCERSLFLFSGSEYEYLLDSLPLPEDSRKDILMFETDRSVDGIYTFNIGCYAASYLAGATSVLNNDGEEQRALVIAANPHDNNVKRAVDGYRDGYIAAGGDECDVLYLRETPDGGYNVQDEAYKICMSMKGNYTFYFSVAGSSNKGVYRFSRENMELTVGMDDDMSLYSSLISFSVVKHIDRAIIDIVGNLLKNTTIPYHQDFTYTSGYEEMFFSSWFTANDFLDISDIKKRIIDIEQSYEESIK